MFLDEAGYFKPKSEFKPLSDSNFIMNNKGININKDTLVLYYPGSFGFFHKGHLDIVVRAAKEAMEITDNYVVVISPANSDYAAEKYGDSNFATNKFRTDQIIKMVSGLDFNIIVDLNPMLNFTVDHNFTDLLRFYINKNIGCEPIELKYTPVIVGGKDRNYSILNDLTNEVQFWFYDEQVEYSTSKNCTPEPLRKKKLYLRVHSIDEYNLFCDHFNDWYDGIEAIYIDDELTFVESLNKDNTITICKDYAHILPYIKVSRFYDTPLSDSVHSTTSSDILSVFKGFTVVDSDIYSGSTKKMVESSGLTMLSLIDLSGQTDNVELLDYDDFKKKDFCYPYVDITSKCSMPPFTLEHHERYKKFISQVG